MVNLAAVAGVSKSLNPNQGRASRPFASCAFCGKSGIGFSCKKPGAATPDQLSATPFIPFIPVNPLRAPAPLREIILPVPDATDAKQRPWQPIRSTIFPVPKSHRFDSLDQMCAYLCMRTTIELPDPLFRSARAAAHERGMTLKELFTEALDKALKSPVKGPKRMDKPPVSGGAGRRIPARTNKELAEILAEDEFSKAR